MGSLDRIMKSQNQMVIQVAVLSICYSPNGNTFASGSHDKSICLWDVKPGKLKAKLDCQTNAVTSICYSPNGNTLVSGSKDKSISFMGCQDRKIKSQ
ncbi:unnamed protein product [Paramecium octaurelia]|uniref:Uncharacterized protein n=1 Tax=Paramecium octaurelia TaxID=43137 RepID=A0A8S1YNJ9_PAROT|nr:unnamed protein product [Paramecium octaurelia]